MSIAAIASNAMVSLPLKRAPRSTRVRAGTRDALSGHTAAASPCMLRMRASPHWLPSAQMHEHVCCAHSLRKEARRLSGCTSDGVHSAAALPRSRCAYNCAHRLCTRSQKPQWRRSKQKRTPPVQRLQWQQAALLMAATLAAAATALLCFRPARACASPPRCVSTCVRVCKQARQRAL